MYNSRKKTGASASSWRYFPLLLPTSYPYNYLMNKGIKKYAGSRMRLFNKYPLYYKELFIGSWIIMLIIILAVATGIV